MRNYLPQQDEPVKKETNQFLKEVKAVIGNGGSIKPKLDRFIPALFNFRLLALKWISQQSDIDLLHLIDRVYPSIEELRNNPKLALLAENLLFAIRCNNRVVKSMIGDGKITSEELSTAFASVPVTTYEQFFGTLALSITDEAGFQSIADFSHASLYIEFILVAAILIDDENMDIPTAVINELSFLIADAAQEYLAIAIQMGIIPSRAIALQTSPAVASTNLEEDQQLSNLGLSDFALNF